APENLCAAESVLYALVQQEGKQLAEHHIAHDVEEFHGALLNRIDESAPIYELARSGNNGAEEFRQLLGHHCQVSIENHQYIAACLTEACPDIFRFADSRAG